MIFRSGGKKSSIALDLFPRFYSLNKKRKKKDIEIKTVDKKNIKNNGLVDKKLIRMLPVN